MTPLRRVHDVAAGDEIPSSVRVVERDDLKAYAEASGDHNPIHLDDGFARSVGFPGVVAHGMLTMGHLTSCVTAWLGDPGALRHMRVQFRSVVYPGDAIVAGGRVREVDVAARRAVLDLWVTLERDGALEHPIKRGEAVVELG